MSFKDALFRCLSSSDEVSFGRAASALALIGCLAWDTFFVIFAACKLNFTHMSIHDILPTTDQLSGQLMFCAGCYGINKVTEIASIFGRKNG